MNGDEIVRGRSLHRGAPGRGAAVGDRHRHRARCPGGGRWPCDEPVGPARCGPRSPRGGRALRHRGHRARARPGPHDVRVQMAASGVCHSDLSVQNGTIPFMFPTVLGHEGAGVVAEVGDGRHPGGAGRPRRAHLDAGVPAVLLVPGGARPCCARWAWPSRCRVPTPRCGGATLVRGLGTATFGEQTLVPEGEVVRVDPSVPLELAALVGCALATGVGAVWHTAQVDAGVDGGRRRLRRRGAVGDPGSPPGRGRAPSWPSTRWRPSSSWPRPWGPPTVVDASAEDAVAAVRAHTGGPGGGLRLRGGGPGRDHPHRLRGGAPRGHGGARRGGIAGRAGVVLRLRALRRRQDGGRAASTGRPTPTGTSRCSSTWSAGERSTPRGS